GVFSSQNYRGILKRNGFTAKDFEDNLKSDLLAFKLQSMVESAVHVSGAEAVDLYLDRRQPLVVEYVVFRPEDFRSKIKADEGEIKEWFEERKERFTVPEERSFSMLVATPKSMADSVSVTDDDLKSYFDEHVSEFETEEQVKASHILAQVSLAASDKEVNAARSKIEKAQKRIDAGEDFAEVAKDISEGPSAQAGGDLGSFPKGQMVKEFEDVAFGLKPGEVSKPFRTEFGWHIIKTYSHTPLTVPKFEEVRDKVEIKAREAKAWEMAGDLISSLSASLLAGQFDDSVKSYEGLKLKRYKAVKGAPIAGIDEWKVVSNVVFDIEKGVVSEPLELSGGFAVLTLNSIAPSHTPAFDEIKDKVKESFIEERSYDMARTSADEMEKEVSGGKDFKEAAKAGGYKVLVTKPYSKASLSDSKTKAGEGMVREAFSMEVGETGSASTRGGAAVFMLSSRGDVDLKEMKAALPAFRRSLDRAKKARVYTEFLTALRKRAEDKGEIEILIDVNKVN
ncbi:Survival protein SurA precursor (Peptidyl-prolyl cis-trans isomerase SurA), partial [hydrothermal vent metagenome]